MIDFTCDLNCPNYQNVKVPKGYCCKWCFRSRKHYVSQSNKHLWSDETGFLGPEGCRLPKEQVPQECKDYDCKEKVWMITDIFCSHLVWKDNKWQAFTAIEGHFIGYADEIDTLTKSIGNNIKKANEAHLKNETIRS